MKNKVLLIGATGLLGSYLYQYLDNIVDIIPTYNKNKQNINDFIKLDITNLDFDFV